MICVDISLLLKKLVSGFEKTFILCHEIDAATKDLFLRKDVLIVMTLFLI